MNIILQEDRGLLFFMATTRGWSLRGNIKNALNYILDINHGEEKTNHGFYVDTNIDTTDIRLTPYHFKSYRMPKYSSIKGYHLQFSLPPGEGSPEICLSAAKEWIEKISKNQANYVIAVHQDKDSIHAHIVADAFLKNGEPWRIYFKRDRYIFRKAADQICKEYGLSVLTQEMDRSKSYYEWMKSNDQSDSNRIILKKVLDQTIPKVGSFEDLKNYMETIGFVFSGLKNETDQNIFKFTVNKKLIHQQDDGSYLIRIPYQQNFIHVDQDYLKWTTESITAQITLPVDINVQCFDSRLSSLGYMNVNKLKNEFKDKTKKYSNLKIKVPGAKRRISTKFLSDDGAYSYTNILKRIKNNGRTISDPEILNVISCRTNYESVLKARRNLFENSDIHVHFKSSSIYKSQKQENYFKWKRREAERMMDKMNYEKLLDQDRRNIETLKANRSSLQKELKEVYEAIEKCDLKIEQIAMDQIAGIVEAESEDIANYIDQNKEPLVLRKNELKEMIRNYDRRIINIENADQDLNKTRRV